MHVFFPAAMCNEENSPKPRYLEFLLGLSSNIKLIPPVWLAFLPIPSQCQGDTPQLKASLAHLIANLHHWKFPKKTKAALLGRTSHRFSMPAVVKGQRSGSKKTLILHYRTKIVVQFEEFLEGKMCKWRFEVWEELWRFWGQRELYQNLTEQQVETICDFRMLAQKVRDCMWPEMSLEKEARGRTCHASQITRF